MKFQRFYDTHNYSNYLDKLFLATTPTPMGPIMGPMVHFDVSGFCPDKQIASKTNQKIDNQIVSKLLFSLCQPVGMYKKNHHDRKMLSCLKMIS